MVSENTALAFEKSSYAGVPWLVQIVGNEAEQKSGVDARNLRYGTF